MIPREPCATRYRMYNTPARGCGGQGIDMAPENIGDVYTEKLMNMILDEIDDMIVIHDSRHTITWMNRAAEKAFGISVDEAIGRKCYSLFGNSSPCRDCQMLPTSMSRSDPKVVRRTIPSTSAKCDCSIVPYYEDGTLRLVVQHLLNIQ